MCKLPSTTPVFLSGCREAHELPPSPRWSPSQGIPRKGQALGRVTPWIAPGLPHAQVGLRLSHSWQSLSRMLSAVFTIKLPAETPRALFPSVHGGGHTTNMLLVWSRKTTSPSEYNNGVRKHREIRGIITSLNTRHKPRASA